MAVNSISEIGDPRCRKTYYLHVTGFRQAATAAAKGLFQLFSDLHFTGLEHLPSEGPVIVAANHLTNFDVFPLQFALERPVFFMGKEELFRNPLMDWVMRRLGSFPVYRGARDEWALAHARQVLAAGQVLGIFPEGTRSQGIGLQRAKSGAARMALAANCPIVPAAIQGTHQLFQRFPRRTPVRVTLGEPIYPQPGELPVKLTKRLMLSLAALLPLELHGVYAENQK